MSDRKAIKRDVKAVWRLVKELRSAQGKNYAAADLAAAGDALAVHAAALKKLAKRMSRLSAMPPGEPAPPRPRKPKRKRRSDKPNA